MKKIILIFPLLLIGFALSGCSVSFNLGGTTKIANQSGAFISGDKGETWEQKVITPTATSSNVGGISVNNLALSKSGILFLGSFNDGLFYTPDPKQGWTQAKALDKYTINAVATDPSSNCIVYVSLLNKVFKTSDCDRSWVQVYNDNNLSVRINTITVDPNNSSIVFIGTSRGEVIRSVDAGANWETVARLESNVKKIAISPDNSSIIFAGTMAHGIFRSTTAGLNWLNLQRAEDLDLGFNFRDIAFSKSKPGLIIVADRYGLMRSFDYGAHWQIMNLITPNQTALINSLAVNPNNPDQIYYVTNTTFYRSLDGGLSWATKSLPSSRAASQLLINPNNTDMLYLGMTRL